MLNQRLKLSIAIKEFESAKLTAEMLRESVLSTEQETMKRR